MKQIAILGSAGEIGEKILNILKNDFNIKAGYHKKHLNRMNNRVTYYHVDIMEYESLRQFVSGSDYVINCAGSSYMISFPTHTHTTFIQSSVDGHLG